MSVFNSFFKKDNKEKEKEKSKTQNDKIYFHE